MKIKLNIWAHSAIVFLITFCGLAYFFVPTSVTLEDSGELLLVAKFFGVAHPPSYPLYSLFNFILAKMATEPNLAIFVHMGSSFFAALSLVLVFIIVNRFTQKSICSYFSVFLCAMAPTLGWLGSIAEVYSQFSFMFLLLFYLLIKEKQDNKLNQKWFSFLTGLSICSHWPLFFLSLPGLVIFNFECLKKVFSIRKNYFYLMLGLCPYAFIFMANSPQSLSATGEINSFADVLFYLFRGAYSQVDKSISVSLIDDVLYLKYFFRLIYKNFSTVGFLFFSLSTLYFYRKKNKRPLLFTFFGLIFFPNILLRLIARTDFDIFYLEIFNQYQMVPLICFSIFLSFGLNWGIDFLSAKEAKIRPIFFIPILITSFGAYSLFLMQKKLFRPKQKTTYAHEMASLYLSLIPQDSLFLLHGDSDTGPFLFLHKGLNVRSDLELISQKGFLARPKSIAKVGTDWTEKLTNYLVTQKKAKKNVYFVRIDPQLKNKLSTHGQFKNYGALTEFSKTKTHLNGQPPDHRQKILKLFDKILNKKIRLSNHWQYYQEALLGPLCKYLATQGVDHPLMNQSVYCSYYALIHLPSSPHSDQRANFIINNYKYFPKNETSQLIKAYLKYQEKK